MIWQPVQTSISLLEPIMERTVQRDSQGFSRLTTRKNYTIDISFRFIRVLRDLYIVSHSKIKPTVEKNISQLNFQLVTLDVILGLRVQTSGIIALKRTVQKNLQGFSLFSTRKSYTMYISFCFMRVIRKPTSLTTIRRTFRTYSYSNEVGHFVSCSEYVVTSDIFCRDTS